MNRIAGLVILAIFYGIYIGKMLLQKRKGIRTDQMARGRRRDRVFYVEVILKLATYSVVAVELISIILTKSYLPEGFIAAGCILGLVGDVIFAAAVITMRDSWRAGLAEADETRMITDGIYRYSRNPAFLGFDLVYLGILLMFFNWILFVFSMFAIIMLHIQILQEESYLLKVFGEEYAAYRSRVCRYLGRKPDLQKENKEQITKG
ncbi:MAG: isoprenylcysteine carboxylmethyltransferase family protein [Acetatifactor sp.]|nr:isoprenylcysteine carboxylmethyltransferase family protein [Acetatifactor sp.]